MAMKLLVHVLRGVTPEAGEEPVAVRSLEPRRWVLGDLVVRRVGLAPWGLTFSLPGTGSSRERRAPASEPLWADTQPWYHN